MKKVLTKKKREGQNLARVRLDNIHLIVFQMWVVHCTVPVLSVVAEECPNQTSLLIRICKLGRVHVIKCDLLNP